MDKLIKYIKDPNYQIGKLFIRHCPKLMSDKYFISVTWKKCFGYKLPWKNPRTFNEKLQWLKLNDHNPLYSTLVDKYAVKKWISEKIGAQYVIPTLGVYQSVEDIDIETLPNQFVLKCTHDSGSVIICKDKRDFNFDEAKSKLSKALKRNYYYVAREWPYKNVPHRIIAEPYLGKIEAAEDYKFFCFNGKVKYFKVDYNRFSNHIANYYDRNGEFQPWGESGLPISDTIHLSLPQEVLEEMIAKAETLSEGTKFMRVDFYSDNGEVRFGECTLYPSAGFNPLTDVIMEEKWGGAINL